MTQEEILLKQLEAWIDLTIIMVEKTINKSHIEKRDIIKIAQKIEDVINVLDGKSKISGWKN